MSWKKRLGMNNDLPIPATEHFELPTGVNTKLVSIIPGSADRLLALSLRTDPTCFSYKIHEWRDKKWVSALDLALPGVVDFVQPVAGNQWLIGRKRAQDKKDLNAHLYDSYGSLVKSFHIGDGIEDVQAVEDIFWVSYFDEGVYGGGELESHGLVCFDLDGRPIAKFKDLSGLNSSVIDDCYALNLFSRDEVWAYYYSEFPLVKIVGRKIDRRSTDVPVHGSHAFAIRHDIALFAGGYKEKEFLHDINLASMASGKRMPVDLNGNPIKFKTAKGRGTKLYLIGFNGIDLFDLTLKRSGA